MAIIIVSVAAVILIGITAVLWILGGEIFFMAPSYSKMDRFLKANIDELSYVSDALFELNYDHIQIQNIPLNKKDRYNMRVIRDKVHEIIPIPDELIDHTEGLFNRGVKDISCGRSSVGFSTWLFFGDIRGIRFSSKGLTLDDGNYIEVKQLSKENWYYYVSNFEKWKAQNPELFQ